MLSFDNIIGFHKFFNVTIYTGVNFNVTFLFTCFLFTCYVCYHFLLLFLLQNFVIIYPFLCFLRRDATFVPLKLYNLII
jgi:hypothetical protein